MVRIVLLLSMFPAVASAAVWGGGDVANTGMSWETLIPLILTGLVAVASAISAAVPSVGKVMKVIDFIALNWGKARNDPDSQ